MVYNNTYEYTVNTHVPSFAPSGKYIVTVKGHGMLKNSEEEMVVMCTEGSFDL